MTKIIAVANQKGGVGKTTTSVNLSAALAQRGKRVLLVDLDPQGNSTSGLGISKNRTNSVYDILINEVEPQLTLCESCVEGLSVIPAAMSLAGAEVELVNMEKREHRLKEALAEFSEGYDYVLIDCPPSLGLLTLNAFCYANKLLIPIQCEYYALEGLSLLMNTLRLVRNGLNPGLDLCGVVLTMFDGRTNLSAQVVSEVKKYYKNKLFNTIIPRAVRLGEAPSFGQPICVYAPRNIGAIAYDNLAQELIKREG